MRLPERSTAARLVRASIPALAVLFAASVTTTAAAQGSTPTEGPGASVNLTNTGCTRSVDGDVATIKRLLERGHAERAYLYVQGLTECPEAQTSVPYLTLAFQTLESLGELNVAWKAGQTAVRAARDNGDAQTIETTEAALDEFRRRYVQLDPGPDRDLRLTVRYAGPIMDDATRRQLEEVALDRSVKLSSGSWGFWLSPGRYEVNGDVRTLRGGQSVLLGDEKEEE